MTTFSQLALTSSDPTEPFTDRLRLAVASYLARFKGSSREHTESDLRCYLAWCAERGLDPLTAQRPHLERYVRWMQEIRRFKPSTVSRRFSAVAGFYRTCALDGIIEHSPAEHVRRPSAPAESPTLGFTHLQFETLLAAARESATPCDFALVAMAQPRLRALSAVARVTRAVSWARLVMSSLVKTWVRWVFTVARETNRRSAMPGLDRPSATSCATSRSVGVRLSQPRSGRCRRPRLRRA